MNASDESGAVDLQVNGYLGVDFNNEHLSLSELRIAVDGMQRDGVSSFLATIITDSVESLEKKIHNLVLARQQDSLVAKVLSGLHIEGPFLSPQVGYIGAHPPQHARPADLDSMKRLFDAANGLIKIVTLAPECDPGFGVTAWLRDQGVVVSAGHCNPTLQQLQGAIEHGLSMFTHLGNGCPLHLHRHDNIVQRVLSLSEHLFVGFIADGIHVPFVALGNYLRAVGFQRSFIVTDAVAAAGMGPGTYSLAGQDVVVDDQLATWVADRSHLVGSAMTMPRVRTNLQEHLGLDGAVIDRLTRLNPLAALGELPD